MSLYEKFTNEASFRANFVKPLLNKLGFFLVAEYHGRREFGKDFVFSELHRFGGIRHYAAQVKHERTIGLGKAADDLLTQINQAFANPFTLPDSQREAYISAFYPQFKDIILNFFSKFSVFASIRLNLINLLIKNIKYYLMNLPERIINS